MRKDGAGRKTGVWESGRIGGGRGTGDKREERAGDKSSKRVGWEKLGELM